MSDVRLMLGDCLELMRSIPEASVDLILCDLPYGTTACAWDTVIPFEPLWAEYKRVIKPRGAVVLFASQPFTSELIKSNLGGYRYSWYWQKERATGFQYARFQPMRLIEDVCVFGDEPPRYFAQLEACKPYKHALPIFKSDSARMTSSSLDADGNRVYKTYETKQPANVLTFARDYPKVHPTQKPVALLEYLIRTYSNEGETVLDNCIGSGSTIVAALNTGRNAIGIEKDPNYFAIAQKRIDAAQQQTAIPFINGG